jgi:translation initiation factor IF-1
MTKSKYDNPRSKIRGRPDGSTVTATIPAKIAHPMRLKPGDVVEWIWTTEGYDSFAKVRKVIG